MEVVVLASQYILSPAYLISLISIARAVFCCTFPDVYKILHGHKTTYVNLAFRLDTTGAQPKSSSPGRGMIFLLSTPSTPALGPTQPPIKWVREGALSPGVKQPVSEGDYPPPTTSELKNTWIYTSTPPYVFMT
jgi:hypothetical protein